MNTRKFILQETALLALGEILCSAAMVALFALLGYFDYKVVLGAVLGCLIAVGNFFFMAIGAMIAADKATQDDVKGGKTTVRTSMFARLVVMALLLIIFARSGHCNVIALLVPLVFTRPILTIDEFFRKSGDQNT